MIRTRHSNYPVAAVTHPGMTGKNNEDRYAVSAFRLDRRGQDDVLLAVLADGIGGHRAGEVAAEIAVERISRAVASSNGKQAKETLRQAITQASEEIQNLANSDPSRQGMGTTCVCAWIINRRLYAASVGDSRLYLIRGGAIRQLNTDHTWIQEALEQGLITPDQVKGHPNQHIIRRYIGSPTPPEVDFRLRSFQGGSELADRTEVNQGMLLEEGDRLVLCSDGLTDLVTAREILAAFSRAVLQPASQQLVDLANQRGGHDNITVVAVEIPRRSLAERLATSNRLFSAAAIAAGILAFFVFVGTLIGFDWLNNLGSRPTATPGLGTFQPTQALPVTLPSETLTPAATSPLAATPAVATYSPAPPTTTFTVTLPGTLRDTPTPWPTNTVSP